MCDPIPGGQLVRTSQEVFVLPRISVRRPVHLLASTV